MAVFTPQKLYTGQPAATAATLYTAPASTKTIVKNIICSNTTTSDAKITLSLVPSAGTQGVTNQILSALTVKANDTVSFDCSAVLATGDFISAFNGTAGAITLHISGVEVV